MADTGVQSPNLPRATTLDSILGNSGETTSRQFVTDLAAQLVASEPMRLGTMMGKLYDTVADLPAVTEQVTPWVTDDPDVDKRGIYKVSGGIWVWGLPLPYSIIKATIGDGDTVNVRQLITTLPVVDGTAIIIPVVGTNTASPVVVHINGGDALTLKSNSGANIDNGGLPSSGRLMAIREGGILRLNNDVVATAVLTATETARDLAKDFANKAEDQVVEDGLYSAKHWALKAQAADAGSGAAAARDAAVAAKNIAAAAAVTSLSAEDNAEAAAAASIAASTAAVAAASNAQSSALTFAAWTGGLVTVSGTVNGQGAEVLDSDIGTHLQATATGYDGASVPNAGRYSYNATWSRWVRIGATGLSGKQTVQTISSSETGWLYVITDATDKVSFGIDLSGKAWLVPAADVKILESNMPDAVLARQLPTGITTASNIPPESGFIFGWTDAAGNIAWGIKADGTFWTNFASDCAFPSALLASISATTMASLLPAASAIECFGDSLTAGAGGGGTTYPAVLAAALGRTVNNRGIGGQNSAAIATRQGGLKMLVSVTGNTIPASGAVTLTARSQTPITNQGASSFAGTLAGVAGTLAASTADGGATYTYTFTRTTAGSEIACPANSEFVFDIAEAAKDKTQIIWISRNDAKGTRAYDVASRDNGLAMAKHLTPLSKRYLVLSILNGLNEGTTTGSSAYNNIASMNAELARTFGDRFIDVRSYLVKFGLADAGITPTSQDIADMAEDTVPASLRSDSIHLTATGYTLVANFVARHIQARGW